MLFVVAVQGILMLCSFAVAYAEVAKERTVHKGTTIAQIEQLLGPPIPHGTMPIGTQPGGEERAYHGVLRSEIHVQYQNGVAEWISDRPGIISWGLFAAVTGFNLWCLLTAIPLAAYRALASPRGEFRYRQILAPRFSMLQMLVSMTVVILGIVIFVLIFRYGIANGMEGIVGLPLVLIAAALIGGAAGSLINRPGFGVLVGLWMLISVLYFGLVAYAMHPAIG